MAAPNSLRLFEVALLFAIQGKYPNSSGPSEWKSDNCAPDKVVHRSKCDWTWWSVCCVGCFSISVGSLVTRNPDEGCGTSSVALSVAEVLSACREALSSFTLSKNLPTGTGEATASALQA